jgi:hypothetical protein
MEYAFESLGPTLRYVVLVFMLFFAVSALIVIVLLAALPGQVAKRTGHPQANAINVCGWLGLPTGVLWVVAMVWPFTRRPSAISSEKSLASNDFDVQLKRLEYTVEQLENQLKK